VTVTKLARVIQPERIRVDRRLFREGVSETSRQLPTWREQTLTPVANLAPNESKLLGSVYLPFAYSPHGGIIRVFFARCTELSRDKVVKLSVDYQIVLYKVATFVTLV
jgi:hypothetical protein